jgi:succinate dehydrogenase / fumarate reductase flavoprotein subunit
VGLDGKSPEQGIAADILVVGAGGSGLRAAIGATERGMSVMVVSTRRKADAHTSLAAGGINATPKFSRERDAARRRLARRLASAT